MISSRTVFCCLYGRRMMSIHKIQIVSFILLFFSIATLFGQTEPGKVVFDYEAIFFSLPSAAFPVRLQGRKEIAASFFNSSSYNQSLISSLRNVKLDTPVDSTVITTYQFHIHHKVQDSLSAVYDFKVYLTKKDTFIITHYQKVVKKEKPSLIVKVFRMRENYQYEHIEIPIVRATDFAKTPKDSILISQMLANGELSFGVRFENQFEQKGIRYFIIDHTLNTGPFEPPKIKAEKYFSDFQVIDRPLGVIIDGNGIKYEN